MLPSRSSFLRVILRRPGHAILNVVGLATGMSVCLLIGLYLREETQVDRFHEHAERLVQIGFELNFERTLSTPYPLASMLEESLSAVEHAMRTYYRSSLHLARDEIGLEEQVPVLYAEPNIFKAFTFQSLHGDPADALSAPNGVVITERVAQTFFGDADPIGQPLRLGETREVLPGFWEEESLHVVGAVVRDLPRRSTIEFDALIPITALPENQRQASWGGMMFQTYALLAPRATAHEMETLLPALLEPHFRPEFRPTAFVMPFTSVYFSDFQEANGFRGEQRYLYVFGFAALFVLLIASINYVNLATVHGLGRAREIGVRKAVGASRSQIALQFLGESAMQCLAALVLALGATALALPGFNALFGTEIVLGDHVATLGMLVVFVLGVALAAATYPAFFLSHFDPVRVLRRHQSTGAPRGGGLRKSLVVVQFSASTILLIGTAVVFGQLRHMQTKDLGFNSEQVVVFEGALGEAWDNRDAIRQLAVAHPAVLQVAMASSTPGGQSMQFSTTARELSPEASVNPETTLSMHVVRVDEHYLETLDIHVVAGQSFDPERTMEGLTAFVINETTARTLGWTPEEAVGHPFTVGWTNGEIGGVVADFHVGSMRNPIPSVVLQMSEISGMSSVPQIVARLSPHDIPGALGHLEAILEQFVPEGILAFTFLDERFYNLYESERRLVQAGSTFALLAILVASLGLFGLIGLVAKQRTREVGIRKAHGASTISIALLVSKDFLKLVVVALVIATPPAYWMMSRWLEDFTYRTSLGPGPLATATVLTLAVTLLTVGYHTLRMATSNPVKSLRSE